MDRLSGICLPAPVQACLSCCWQAGDCTTSTCAHMRVGRDCDAVAQSQFRASSLAAHLAAPACRGCSSMPELPSVRGWSIRVCQGACQQTLSGQAAHRQEGSVVRSQHAADVGVLYRPHLCQHAKHLLKDPAGLLSSAEGRAAAGKRARRWHRLCLGARRCSVGSIAGCLLPAGWPQAGSHAMLPQDARALQQTRHYTMRRRAWRAPPGCPAACRSPASAQPGSQLVQTGAPRLCCPRPAPGCAALAPWQPPVRPLPRPRCQGTRPPPAQRTGCVRLLGRL